MSNSIDKKLRYARAKAAAEYFQISRSTLWLWCKTRPDFPQPLRVGERVTLFDLDLIETYLKLHAAGGAK